MKEARNAGGGSIQVLSVQIYQFEYLFGSCRAEAWNHGWSMLV